MKTYTDTERQHFAAYVEARAACRPAECHGGLDCWVDYGPPAMTTTRGHSNISCCAGCAGTPRLERPRHYSVKQRK